MNHGHFLISLNTDLGPYVCVKCSQQRDECGSFNHQTCPSDLKGTMGENLLKKQRAKFQSTQGNSIQQDV